MKKLNLTVDSMQSVVEAKRSSSEQSRGNAKQNQGKVSQAELASFLDGNGAVKPAGLRLCGPCFG